MYMTSCSSFLFIAVTKRSDQLGEAGVQVSLHLLSQSIMRVVRAGTLVGTEAGTMRNAAYLFSP